MQAHHFNGQYGFNIYGENYNEDTLLIPYPQPGPTVHQRRLGLRLLNCMQCSHQCENLRKLLIVQFFSLKQHEHQFILMAIFVQQTESFNRKTILCLFCVQNQCVNLRYIWGVCVVKDHFYALKSRYNFFFFSTEKSLQENYMATIHQELILLNLQWVHGTKLGHSRNISFKCPCLDDILDTLPE